jgi:uncharacterized protein YrzB (UPF0473 family)
MGDTYGGNYLTIVDEEGNEFELEHLDTIEYNGQVYMAFLPAQAQEAAAQEGEEDLGMIILRVLQEGGEEQLVTLDSEAELEAVYEKFMESLYDDEDEEEDD